METYPTERIKLLDDSENESYTTGYIPLEDNELEPMVDIYRLGRDEILYKFLPIRDRPHAKDILLLADYINTAGLDLPARKAIKNLAFKKEFVATNLLVANLNPKKIVHLTPNVHHVGRALLTLIYKIRIKYIKRHKDDDQNNAHLLTQHETLLKLSTSMTRFCGEMYRADEKMRQNPTNRCEIL